MITIIPAQAGFRAVYDIEEERTLAVYDHIIAWKIQTYERKDGNPWSECIPLAVDGELTASNFVGIQHPDMSIQAFDAFYNSLAELIKERYPK